MPTEIETLLTPYLPSSMTPADIRALARAVDGFASPAGAFTLAPVVGNGKGRFSSTVKSLIS